MTVESPSPSPGAGTDIRADMSNPVLIGDLDQASSPGAACNESPPASVAGNLQTIRKTLSRFLRFQRPSLKDGPRKRPQRHKLVGWPPRWVRWRSSSPSTAPNAQRALPPVPQQPPAASHHEEVEDDRISTPEMRPEDFPPGVAYLPDGDDDPDDHPEFQSSNDIIDFAASIETVKNVIIHDTERSKHIIGLDCD